MKQISAKKAVATSFFVDLGDIILNVIVVIITGSVVMLAEALEGGSDLVASGALLIGLRISKRRADRKHPFGYGKALFFWTLISAIIMLVFASSLSFYFGLKRFLNPEAVESIYLAYGALCISIATNGYALTLSTRRLLHHQNFRKIIQVFLKSTHVETKNTFVLDLTGTGAAVMGLISLILYQMTGAQYFDGLGGMLIGVLIALSSIVLIWGVKNYLIGKRADPATEQKIRQAALQVKQVKEIVELNTIFLGSERLLIHLDIQIQDAGSLKAIESIVDKVKEYIKKDVANAYSIQIETTSTS
jgi:cation diffusion facilitator family transporter